MTENCGGFQINDSARYLFDAVERIMAPDFEPTDDDILRARVRTTGVSDAFNPQDAHVLKK